MNRPKKRFGQHFLTDPRKAGRLVDALQVEDGETVLEVGAGTGILTERILARGADLIAVEIDRDLIASLRERFGGVDRFELIEGDIIGLDPTSLRPGGFKVIGNLPYNISGAFAEWLIEHRSSVRFAVITFQKQVADRLKAGPGGRDYGALSVMVQCFYDIRRLFDIPPGCFSPKPRVDSTVLKLEPRRKLDKEIDYGQFKEFLRGCFFQKRKRLTNSLAAAMKVSKETIEKSLADLGRKADTRAEQLSLQELMRLYKAVRIYV
jgi:16S rRNA (adenine1518-N6/adenine1519-N6)-dimethyltransferase